MDAARQRLQNQFDDQAASFAQKQKEVSFNDQCLYKYILDI